LSIRFVSDNFNHVFPHLDPIQTVEKENHFLNHVHPEDLPNFLLKVQSLKKSKNTCSFEFRIFDQNGEEKWFKLMAGKVNDEAEKNFWLAYLEEIHEKKMAIIRREKLVYETLDEERNRIAMELHDDLGQHLVSLNLFLSMVEKEAKKDSDMLTRCKELAQGSITKMKSLVYNLAPPELDKGISNALESLFGKMNELTNEPEFHFSNKLNPNKEMSKYISYNLFRIVQEFISNSQKYSGCTNIYCLLNSKGLKTSIVISDDGNGFDVESVKRGFGLDNMQKRAKLIGATFDLQSEIGSGTILSLEF
jgi:signal transduction histidine kinase